MITFYDYTSDFFDYKSRKSTKKTVESRIKAFAFKINCELTAAYLARVAEDVGLTLADLRYVGNGGYITFGVSNKHDVSYVKYYDDVPRGVKILRSISSIENAIEKMANKKAKLVIKDIFREKTYRELATGVPYTRKNTTKSKKNYRKNTNLTISDHYIMVDNHLVGMKKPKDDVIVHYSV